MIALEQPRRLGELGRIAMKVFRQAPMTFVVIALVVAAPLDFITFGALGQLSSNYEQPAFGIRLLAGFGLVIVAWPAVAAAQIPAILDISQGRKPSTIRCLRLGARQFPGMVAASALAVTGIYVGFALLLVPGLYLLVSWYLVPQIVMLTGKRGVSALTESRRLIRGSWWRVLGILAAFEAVAGVPELVLWIVDFPARGGVLVVLGRVIADGFGVSVTTLVATLLYFDLRSRGDAHEEEETMSLSPAC